MRNILHVIQLAGRYRMYVSMLIFCKDPNDFEKGAYVILSKGKSTEYPNAAVLYLFTNFCFQFNEASNLYHPS